MYPENFAERIREMFLIEKSLGQAYKSFSTFKLFFEPPNVLRLRGMQVVNIILANCQEFKNFVESCNFLLTKSIQVLFPTRMISDVKLSSTEYVCVLPSKEELA